MVNLLSGSRMLSLLKVATSSPYFSITFDDGPDPRLTPYLLDVLDAHGARATFFVVGEKVLWSSAIAREIVARGHELGNHTYHHRYLMKCSSSEVQRQIDLTQEMIFDTTGARPRLYRAPHGRITEQHMMEVEHHQGLQHCYWSFDTKDWRDQDSELIACRLEDGAKPGEIVLAHDTFPTTVSAVAAALPHICSRSLQCVPVSELLEQGVPLSQHAVTTAPAPLAYA